MATTSNLFMYSLTLVPSSAITQAVVGQFTGTKEQQILAVQGARLVIYRPDAQLGKLIPIYSHDVFGIIRKVATFRLAGSNKDYIIIGSDSGRAAIVEYLPDENRFKLIHLETFGKSGVRRVIPGQYLAADPKGRACMVASIEKNKLVYVLNRNPQAELTISSPLEAHKPQTIVSALIGLDVGYENPIFAALETDYGESDQDPTGQAYREREKHIVYYELDLGLNHVVRKWADVVDTTANMLFQVPGGQDGPSGVLVCGEENITYQHSNQDPLRVAIPRRRGRTEDPDRKRYITAGIMHKMRGAFFYLLQTEDGDLFKVTIDLIHNESGQPTGDVKQLKIKYFDTVPPATSLTILKSGFLFVACENGNHHFYIFETLGDDDDEEEYTSDAFPPDPKEPYTPAYFSPRPLKNIYLNQSVEGLNPMMGCKVLNLADEDSPQIYTINGSGARSSFKVLKHGLQVLQVANSELPAAPSAVWTTKKRVDNEYDAYIILSFHETTIVLGIGDNIEQVYDSGFLSTSATLGVQLLDGDSLIQIHPKGIRQILASGEISEWPAPQHRSIVAASTNEYQVVIALSSGEIVYFEVDPDGALAEFEEKKMMSGTVTCLSLGEVPEGRKRSSFLAVGCDDATVRILSLDPSSTLENKSVQALTAAPSDLRIMPMADSYGGSTLYLHIGLHSGVYLRTVVDEITGELIDTRIRFLGPRPVRLFRVKVQDEVAVLALSSRPWLGYAEAQTRNFVLTPLDYPSLEWGCYFSSEQCPEGMVGIEGRNLHVFQVLDLTENIIRKSIPLRYTPRNFVRHPELSLFYVIEAENNTLSPATREKLLKDPEAINGDIKMANGSADVEPLPAESFGYPRGKGHWSSCIQVVNPFPDDNSPEILTTIELEDNEACTSVAIAPFTSQDDEHFLVVGTGKDMVISPRSYDKGQIHVYRLVDGGRSLEFIHKTQVEAPPMALLGFQGRLLVGIGTYLYIYDLGMRQMLRKARQRAVPNLLTGLQTQGSRIICSDIQESVTFVVYKQQENLLLPFADDVIARWTTCTTMVDYETAAGGDKFGNLWLVRCPMKISEVADEEGSAAHMIHEKGYLQGTSNRLDLMMHIYVSDIPTSVQKVSLVAGGKDILFWGGLQGTLGVLIPFQSREDVDMFQKLEHELRFEGKGGEPRPDGDEPPLAGRDHLIYRSYYVPVKGCIDGDLCERFFLLKRQVKERIAAELDREVREIERKIADMRARVAF